jgi:TonB-dependent receptor
MKTRNNLPGRSPGNTRAALAFPHFHELSRVGSRALFTIVGGAVLINPALAQQAEQDSAAEPVEEVVVTGLRASLESAQSLKFNADTFVDSITATDIGAFPDKSVAEALQRVPGITVSRLQSSDDSNHFSAEPATVLIRGLTFVRTQFNGRDSFSADGYRGLNFNDISPELMAGVDSYKNQTAEMIEGGIAGVVNLRTRMPLDSDGQALALTGRVNYGSRSAEPTYEASGVYSKTWDTAGGRFGILLNAAYSNILTRTEAVNMTRISTICSDYPQAGGAFPAANVDGDGNVVCNANPYGGTGWRYAPGQVNFSQVDYDRTRTGGAITLQYENDAKNLVATLTAVHSRYENPWIERSANISWPAGAGFGTPVWAPFNAPAMRPISGNFAFAENGMLQSGVIGQAADVAGFYEGTSAANINHGSAVPGMPFVNGQDACGGVCLTGSNVSDEARIFDHDEQTRDFSFNVKWDITEDLHTSFDVQYIKARTNNYDILVAANSIAQVDYTTDSNGTPKVGLSEAPNVNYADGFLANPHNYWMQFIQDHWENNDADEVAARADVEYDLGSGGWLSSLKAGVRFADREQKVRYSSYNWAPIAPAWSCNGPGFNVDNTTPTAYPAACGNAAQFNGYPGGIWESVNLSDHYDGSVLSGGPMVFLNRATLRDYDLHTEGLADRNVNAPQGWNPLCDRAANVPGEGCFTPAEILNVTEKSKAAYLMLRFGGPETKIGGVNVVGNVGARLVQTDVSSNGQVSFPTAQWYNDALASGQGACDAANNGANQATDIQCWLTPALLAFSTGNGTANSLDKSYTNVLPSLNVRLGFTEKQFVRFGYSKGMSRPDFGLLRNSVSINAPPIDTSNSSPYLIRDANGAVTGYNFIFSAEAGYAGLKPVEADNFDLSYEAYLSESSSFTLGLFYKRLENTIAYGRADRLIENNGSEQGVVIRGPSNAPGSGGTLKGFEVAYQTFFDKLPGAWSGLGVQLNYTRAKQEDINNSNLAIQAGYLPGSTTAFGGGNNQSTGGNGNNGNPLSFTSNVIDSHRLAGISDHSYNVVGLYEYGKIGARLAYSWRSEFVTANLDCCVGLPVWQKASGYLDASARYTLSDNVELSMDVSNLLNTTAVTQQQVFGDSTLTPGADPVKLDSGWVRNDRRFQLGVRFKY